MLRAILLVAMLAACNAGPHLTSRPLRTRVVVDESFDGLRPDEVSRRWLADVPAASASMLALADGLRGRGLRLVANQAAERPIRAFRSVDAVPLRGMRVRLSASARVTSVAGGSAEVEISWRRPRETSSDWSFARSPVRGLQQWTSVASAVDVPLDASSLEIAMSARGTIDVTFDDVRLEASVAPPDHADALRPNQRERLVSLFELIGYLRFFYAGDAATEVDWHRLEVESTSRMLSAHDNAEARGVLVGVLSAIAPDAAIYDQGAVAPPGRFKPTTTLLTRRIHIGLGNGEPYWSFRAGMDEPATAGIHVALHKPLAEIGSCKHATAEVFVARTEGEPTIALELAPLDGTRPHTTTALVSTNHTTTETDLPSDVYGVSFGVFMRGFGIVDISRIQLICDGRAAATLRAESEVLKWGLARHLYKLTQSVPCAGGTCLRLERHPQSAPFPDDFLDVGIGQQLRLQMPLIASTDGKRTLPRIVTPAMDSAIPGDTRASRIASVLDLWIVLRWFYPYFTDLGIDWNSALRPALEEAAVATTSDAQRRALSRLTHALKDDHARVLRPGVDDGLLPILFRSFGDDIIVAATMPPAGDIPVGASLIAIDGVPAVEARRRAAELISAATPAFELRHSTYSLAYGHKGALSSVVVRQPGVAEEVVRWVPHLDRGELVPALRESRPASGTAIAPGVYYVDLDTLTERTWTQVIPQLQHAVAIVFDLRGYVGPAGFVPLWHLTDRELRSPELLVPLVAPTGPRRYEQNRWLAPPRNPRLTGQAIFLTDARAASAPETALQIVRGEHLGVIVGEPSGGTNGNVIEYDLIGGMSMRFTGMRVLNHDGTVLHGRGIAPDIVVHPTPAGLAAGRDEILEAAVRFATRGPGPSP